MATVTFSMTKKYTAISMTKKYTATTRLFFAISGTETATDLAPGSSFAEKQITSCAQVATSPLVLDPVIRNLGLTTTATELAKSVSATVPAGMVILDPAEPSELLGSRAMAELLDELTASYDMVLLDSPPVLPVTDAAVLSKLAGGALVVVGTERITDRSCSTRSSHSTP